MKKFKTLKILFPVVFLGFLTSCSDDDSSSCPTCGPEVPTAMYLKELALIL